jgi:hypothetical protein
VIPFVQGSNLVSGILQIDQHSFTTFLLTCISDVELLSDIPIYLL